MENRVDGNGRDWNRFQNQGEECCECRERLATWACTQTGWEMCGRCFKNEVQS
jgi:hypothetical protein